LKSSVAWGDDGWFDWIEFAAKEVLDVLDDVGAALEVLMFKSAPDVALLVVEKAPNYTAAWRVVRVQRGFEGQTGIIYAVGLKYSCGSDHSPKLITANEEFLARVREELNQEPKLGRIRLHLDKMARQIEARELL